MTGGALQPATLSDRRPDDRRSTPTGMAVRTRTGRPAQHFDSGLGPARLPRPLLECIHVEHRDRAALRLDPAQAPQRVERLVDALAGGADPARELLLGDREVDPDAAARLLAPVVGGELDQPRGDPADRVGRAELGP